MTFKLFFKKVNAMYCYGNIKRNYYCCYISVLSDFNSGFSIFEENWIAFPVSNQRNQKERKSYSFLAHAKFHVFRRFVTGETKKERKKL